MKAVAWAVGAAALVSVPILALPSRGPSPDREIARASGVASDEKAPVEFVVRDKDGRADKIRIGL